MIIDIIKNKVAIHEYESQLKSYHIQQLDFWGFKFDKDTKILVTHLEYKIILPKLLAYLNKEKISYKLTHLSQAKKDSLQKVKVEFENHLKKALEYKNGKINSNELGVFISFLGNNIPRKLKEHQIKAALHLSYIKHGANFSVPGSGKTSVVLTVFEKLRLEDRKSVV